MTSILGQKRKAFWNENGFLVLPTFFYKDEVDAISAAVWRASRRQPGDAISDPHLTSRSVREVALSEPLGMVLAELLQDQPVIYRTTHFERGSEQVDHVDTLSTTPLSEQGLAATWMALEDVHDEAGPLRYYPGSHHIPPYSFATGSSPAEPAEMARWSEYMLVEVERRGLGEQRFLAEKGDLFIWHAQLLHGGSAIHDRGRSRRSLVTHFFTQTDCDRLGRSVLPTPGGWWYEKPPHPLAEGQPGRRTVAPAHH
jgi:phytanoyl-CoA hydroxylase